MSKFEETYIAHNWSMHLTDPDRAAIDLADYYICLKDKKDVNVAKSVAKLIKNRPHLALHLGKYLEKGDHEIISTVLLSKNLKNESS